MLESPRTYTQRQNQAEILVDQTSTEIYRILGPTLEASMLSLGFRETLLHLAAHSRDDR
jgi:hypothetical protein